MVSVLKPLLCEARRAALDRFLDRVACVDKSGREVDGEGGGSPKMKNLMKAKMIRAMVS